MAMERGLVSKSFADEIADGLRATPAWLKLDDASRCYGISRSGLYNLIRRQKIRSACLREEDNVRGTRLVNVASLDSYITKHEGVWSEPPETGKGASDLEANTG
jgi:hypothetical protein